MTDIFDTWHQDTWHQDAWHQDALGLYSGPQGLPDSGFDRNIQPVYYILPRVIRQIDQKAGNIVQITVRVARLIHKKPVGLNPQGPGYLFDQFYRRKPYPHLNLSYIACVGIALFSQFHLGNFLDFSEIF
jgi:hypothetical protein